MSAKARFEVVTLDVRKIPYDNPYDREWAIKCLNHDLHHGYDGWVALAIKLRTHDRMVVQPPTRPINPPSWYYITKAMFDDLDPTNREYSVAGYRVTHREDQNQSLIQVYDDKLVLWSHLWFGNPSCSLRTMGFHRLEAEVMAAHLTLAMSS